MKFNIDRVRDVAKLVKELAVGLIDLSFADNFVSFEATMVIAATTEEKVRNQLSFIPTRYLVVSQEGGGLITKGTTAWSNDFLYLYNNGASTATIKIVFLR